jgi:hypothetical protein
MRYELQSSACRSIFKTTACGNAPSQLTANYKSLWIKGKADEHKIETIQLLHNIKA